MFTVRGRIGESEYTVSWDDGKVIADDENYFAKWYVEGMAKAYAGERVGETWQGVARNKDHLKDPLAVFVIMREMVFDEIYETTGDVPAAEYEENMIY